MMHTQHGAPPTGRIAGAASRLLSGIRQIQRAHLFRGLVVALALLATAVAVQPASALSREGVSTALRSTVQVIVPDNDFEMFSLGSGTVMNTDGLILTNNHVVEGESRNGLMNNDALAFIAVPPADLRGEAIIKYFGVIAKTDADIDLALVQIIGLVDDPEAPLPANLGLPAIEYGNSDDLMIGDEINMFGYPGLGGNTPTYTKGTVAGFLDEDRNGVYEWIKTDAELNHGNSGGLSTDDLGRFVGVPTAGNTDDTGKIGLVRSGNLALDFVNSYFPNPAGDGPQVTNVQYAEVINRRGEAVNPATQFPTGTTDIYAVFDYKGFANGGDFSYVWYADGQEIARDAFGWDGGASGTNWVSTYDDNGLPDGFIELQILYGGTSIYRGGVMIGEGNLVDPVNPGTASFGDITFAEGVSGSNQPQGVNTSFANVQEVYGFFDYEGMVNGAAWTSRWYYQDQLVLETPSTWDGGANGTSWVSIYHPDGLPVGQFDLELEVQGEIFQTGSFTVQDGGVAPTTEVGVIGVVNDRNNQRTTISGALVVFLQPGFTVDEWIDEDFPDSMIHGTANSNRRGEFQLDNTVIPGEFYSIVVVHDDYQPVAVDDWQIPEDTGDPYELEVSMDRS
ncbi:MAG: trypsin-like peptidase domain-containing protein [Caldilineaceae bacterium]|nr:trypsin-like peptidase domain-containing protein [Caldilineaceae bacterium]